MITRLFLATTICGKSLHGKKERKVGYTFLDRSMRSVYNKNKEEPYA